MEWQRHCETAAGQYPAASAAGGFCSPALARLEPQRASRGLHAARATSAPRGQPLATRHRKALHRDRDPLPCAASTFASLVGTATGSPCAPFNSGVRHDQALRHPGILCCLARVGDGLTPRFLPSFFSDPFAAPSSTSWSFLLAFAHLLPFWLPMSSILPSLTGWVSSSQRLSLLRSR